MNEQIKIENVKLMKVYINDKDKNNKPLMYSGRPYRKIAIQTDRHAGYLSKMIWNENDPVLQWSIGMEVELIVYQSGDFWNFRLPTRLDKLEIRLNELEEIIKTPDGREIKHNTIKELEEDIEERESLPF